MRWFPWLKTRQHRARRRRAPLWIEQLEDRTLLAGNLSMTSLTLVDGGNNVITLPVIGEKTYVRANWTTTGLAAADQYIVRFSMDGVPLDSGSFFNTTI